MSTTHTFRIEGMHCGSCALLIDDALEDLPGLRRTQTSMKRARTVVELAPGGATAADVIAAVEELGYTARHMS
ncbi:heavy-metal-associated domain-containing protein [Pseudonocardia broussonetiae]|uniref:Heavy-metal-associated domain-containing protein n=1 Tax=Pseudonocardia broussonetiae TaxID=2736640 RepID=A0A6M6JKY2_9PSEU|nr:heavy-metal-associated domain-containing protein [Pseudonocardia broussonetiae]QJY47833.1 heavy-metal-associated domain-containing protein [Pseudonocardia broussonetiae]